jgi:exosortase K
LCDAAALEARERGNRVVKTKLLWLTASVLAIWGMKRYYSDARADDLWWILGPTARLVGAITGSAFMLEPGTGYLSRERLFVIEKACAGINFMIAAFGTLTFVLRRRVRSWLSGAGVMGISLLASYSAAVLVNAARITVAMWLAAHSLTVARLTAAHVHRLEGIVVYFGGLMLVHEVAVRVDRSATAVQVRW